MAQKTAARIALVVSCWLFLLTRWVWTFSYQTNDDQLLSWMLESRSFGFMDGTWGPYLVFIGPALSKLYAALPGISWYGMFFYAYLLVVLGLLLYTTFGLLYKRWGLLTAIMVTIAAAWAVFPEHWIGFNFTRAAMLGAGTALLGESMATKRDSQARWLRVLLLVTAVCIRPQAALLGALIGSAWLWLVLYLKAASGQRYAAVVSVLMLAGTIILPNFLPGQIPSSERDRVQGHNAFFDYGWERPNWVKDAEDSLLAKGLMHWFDADVDAYDAEFFQRSTWPSWKESPGWKFFPDLERWQAVRASLAPDTFTSIRAGILLLSLFLFYGLTGAPRLATRHSRWAMLLLAIMTTIGLAALAYFLKLPNRALQPAFTLMLFGVLFCSAGSTRQGPGRNWLTAAAVTFILLGVWPQWQLRNEQTAAIKTNRARITAWWASYPDSLWERPTLISLPVYLHLLVDGDPISNFSLPPDPVLVDGWLARLPTYQNMAFERLGTSSYGAQWCQWTRQDAVLVSSKENAAFFSRYLLLRYDLEMEMKRIWSREGISAFELASPNPCDTL